MKKVTYNCPHQPSLDDSLMNIIEETQEPRNKQVSKNENEDFIDSMANSYEQTKRKRNKRNKLMLTLSAPSVDGIHSEESEDDILAVLDYTPDSIDANKSFPGLRFIPYSRLFELQSFSEIMPQVFISRQSISLNVISIDHQPGPLSFMNQHVVTIALHHGSCHWTIHRKTRQLTSLHNQLRYFKAKLKLPAASSETRERRQSMRTQIKKPTQGPGAASAHKHTSTKRMVKFPRREISRMDGNVKRSIETYMSNLLCHPLLKGHESVLEFFEISPISFVSSLGSKLMEGYVRKRSQGGASLRCGSDCVRKLVRRWMVLKETCLFFLSPQTGQIRTVMLMDTGFQVSHGFRHTGVPKGVKVTNLSKTVVIRCDGEESEKDWARAIEKTKNNFGHDFIRENRFFSFAPVRRKSEARWYVDGSWYMSDIADSLELAQDEIFITDWWLSPDIYMKRPDLTGIKWKLSEILKRQADRGVKVFILLYKEVTFALGLDSLYSKHCLGRLSSNIKVLRHPDHLKSGALYWAHHEKMVIIDQQFAFVGGIDLCYGRWDDHRHKLADVGHGGLRKRPSTHTLGLAQLVQSTHSLFSPLLTPDPGNSSSDNGPGDTGLPVLHVTSDCRERESSDGDSSEPCHVNLGSHWNSHVNSRRERERTHSTSSDEETDMAARKPRASRSRSNWNLRTMKDIGLGLVQEVKKNRAKSLVDRAIVKLQRSDSVNSEEGLATRSDDEQLQKKVDRRKRLQIKWKRGLRRYRPSHRDSERLGVKANSLADLHKGTSGEEASSVHLWVGKDYVNWITKDLFDAQSPFKDNVNRHRTPRMPWHDIALYVEGEAARDAARHFIQRWNAIKTEKVKHKAHYPYLIPRTYNSSFFFKSNLEPKHNVKCQVVRSIGPWSSGLAGRERERSIYLAYISAIKNSKHFIYIENQFFITACSDARSDVFNTIGFHLAERIIRAHRNGETFRVYLVLPLLPAFEGLVGTPNGTPMQYIIYYTYISIIRGPNSLIGRLTEENISWQNYLTICSLRNHELLEGDLVSELIYVHSKLMIVDDRLVIAGSANINDRSLLGDRDSEVDLIIEDNEFSRGLMNGQPYNRGDFAGSLRMYLFSEHLGLNKNSSIDIRDPVSDQFFRLWQGIASKNTKVYDEVFSSIPCDAASTFSELRKLRAKVPLSRKTPGKAKEMLEKIQGHLVLFPLMFLKNEPLKPGPGNKEFLLPFDLWT